MNNRYVPLLTAILAISLVGVGLSLTIPLISVRMEEAGYSGEANGWGVALSGLATIVVSPLIPTIVRAVGLRAALASAWALTGQCRR